MLQKNLEAKIRLVNSQSLEKASLQGAARVYINVDTLISLAGSVEGGRHCIIERISSDPENETIRREASLCALPNGKMSPNIIMVTRAFQEAAGFKLGDHVRLTLTGEPMPDADVVEVQQVSEPEPEPQMKYPHFWQSSLSASLDRAELIFPGMVLEGVSISKLRRSYKVLSVNSQQSNVARFKLATTAVQILQEGEEAKPEPEAPSTGGDLVVTGVPGLSSQIKVLNQFLEGFTRPMYFKDELVTCAIVIHGGRGTGKTFILEQIAATGWGRSFWIRPTDKLSAIRETFKQARDQQPSMVFIDRLEVIVDKERANREAVIEQIGEELDALSAQAKAANALPRTVVVVTCRDYMTDIPENLQLRSRLYENIALPIPRAAERLEILEFIDPPFPADEKKTLLWDMAQKTHAYTGNDLANLVQNCKRIAGRRLASEGADPSGQHCITKADFENAFPLTRATAMHDINLKPPTIHWQDVGGQQSLKKVLSRMIKNAKNTNPKTLRVLPHYPKGLLLYGPPGCSKTLSAQAMATESSFNFFAVKGAELLNMYVGESERAVRTLFERARAAAPSIIFFDEIDSIGGQRSPGGGSASRSTGAVNMLTTLLTEMDGFEALSGVLILAATNRPESIDPALMRPGRFDNVLYVGPPDHMARESVFGVHLRNLSLAADVDMTELARLSDGYSGAEIKAICIQAGEAALDRWDDDETGTVTLEITMADLVAAVERTPRNITPTMLMGYEAWSRQFKKS